MGLHAKKMASTHGGEYHSPCPSCQGQDRFCIWPKQGQNGRYWCRQCGKSGDAIQYCRDFMNLSFQNSCEKVGQLCNFVAQRHARKEVWHQEAILPNPIWQNRASSLIDQCHYHLMGNEVALKLLQKRGLTVSSARRYKLGWLPSTQ